MKKELVLIAVVLFSLVFHQAFALVQDADCFSYYKFQDGLKFENFHADKNSYTAGKDVIVSYSLKSYMEAPIVQGSVKAQILFEENGIQNIVDEFFVAKDINMQVGDTIKQEFKWTVPTDVKSGDYAVKVYFIVADRFNLAGINFIPSLPGEETVFSVVNPSSYSRIYFDQSSTFVNDKVYSSVGFPSSYEVGKPIIIKTKIVNDGTDKRSVKVLIEAFRLDDVLKSNQIDGLAKEMTMDVNGGEKKDISYDIQSLDSGPYLIKMTAFDGSKILSIMKVRVSVEGAKGIFNYLGLNVFPLLKDKESTLFFCLSNSADYLTSFNGTGYVEILDENNKQIFKESFGPFEISPSEPQGKIVKYTPQNNLFKVTVKGFLYDENNKLMDSPSVVYDYSKFSSITRNLKIEAKKNYSPGDALTYTITYSDDYGNPLKESLLVYLTDKDEKLIYTKNVTMTGSATGEIQLSKDLSPGTYKLAAFDLKNNVKSEQTINISAAQDYTFVIIVAVVLVLVLVFLFVKFIKGKK